MTISIVDYINQYQKRVEAVVDKTFYKLLLPTTEIDQVVRTTSYAQRKIALAQIDGNMPTLATVVAPGQEIPASKPRATLNIDTISNLKLGKKRVWLDPDYELMHDLQMATDPELITAIEKYFFGQIQELVDGVYNRARRIGCLILLTGEAIFTDPISGAEVEISYTDGLYSGQFPAALAGGNAWTASTTATPLTNVKAHVEDLKENFHGRWPIKMLLPWTMLRAAADSREMKTERERMRGNVYDTPSNVDGLWVQDDEAREMLAMYAHLPSRDSVQIVDNMFSAETAAGTIDSTGYYLSDASGNRNYYTLVYADGQVESAFVPTVERRYAPGLFQHSKVVEEAPLQERTVVVGNMIPLVRDNRMLAARKVA